MYQELIEPKRGKLSDALIIIICVVLIFVLETAAVALRQIAKLPVMIFQFLFVAGLIYFCIWYYKNRLRSVRITFFTDDSGRFGELLTVPDGFFEFENGSLLVETLVGTTGSYAAMIHSTEMLELYKEDKTDAQKKKARATVLNTTGIANTQVYCLRFEQDKKQYLLKFQPSEKLACAISESIESRKR